MSKRIAICFDGTWNTPDNDADLGKGVETNVCRIYRSIRTGDGSGQQAWYDEGVGTRWYDRLSGGAFGLGLSRNIRQGYKTLSRLYEDGDEVFIFGFSRGAYTARSLVGLIRNCGLLPRGALKDTASDRDPLLLEAYELYRARDEGADGPVALAFRKKHASRIIPIRFLGVWDTVGALGIPVGAFRQFNRRQYEFHDTELSSIVENAYHALAIDEHREPYDATLWDPVEKPRQTIEQRWFVGAHADVGGGYEDRRLSDLSLRWMQDKAKACGLDLRPELVPEGGPDACLAPLTDSYAQFLKGSFRIFHDRYFRTVNRTRFGEEGLHETVATRRAGDRTYRPRNRGL